LLEGVIVFAPGFGGVVVVVVAFFIFDLTIVEENFVSVKP